VARVGFRVLVFLLKDAFGVEYVPFLIQISQVEILLGYFSCFLFTKPKLSYLILNLKKSVYKLTCML